MNNFSPNFFPSVYYVYIVQYIYNVFWDVVLRKLQCNAAELEEIKTPRMSDCIFYAVSNLCDLLPPLYTNEIWIDIHMKMKACCECFIVEQ